MIPRVARFNRNERGRDFAVGDIHGAYNLVWKAMQRARFNPEVDRLFAVGDLIDRGADSYRCAKFLSMPYVHAVRGNHEEMLLDLYASGDPPPELIEYMAMRNGLAWWLSVDEAQRRTILAAIANLPFAIEIETVRGKVGLIHADVPEGMSWPEFIEKIEAGDSDTVETCLWGRKRIKRGDQAGIAGIGRVFVGHTPQPDGLARFGNVYAIDSGAVFGLQGEDAGHLTMACIVMATESLLVQQPVNSLVDLRDNGGLLEAPFGASLLDWRTAGGDEQTII